VLRILFYVDPERQGIVLVAEIESRPGAADRIHADVERMNRVLQWEKLRQSRDLTQKDLAEVMVSTVRRSAARRCADNAR